MAVVDRDISPKPIDEDSTLDVLNREIVPVSRMMRAAINRHLLAYSKTVGDGAETIFDVVHGLNSEDVFVSLRDVSSGAIIDQSTYTITVTDETTVRVVAPAPPATNDLRISVRV